MLHYYGESCKKTLPQMVSFSGYLTLRIIIFSGVIKIASKISLNAVCHGLHNVTHVVYNVNISLICVNSLCHWQKNRGSKMSYPINGPNKLPGILEAQNMKNNGGGGNLGYFKREKKKNKKDEIDVFQASMDENDEFVPEEDLNAKNESLLDKASELIKMFKIKKSKA